MKDKICQAIDTIHLQLDKISDSRITLDKFIENCNFPNDLSGLFQSELVRYVIHNNPDFELRRGMKGGLYRKIKKCQEENQTI